MNPSGDERLGVWYGIAAYGLWGAFPLYFVLLDGTGPVEIVMHRVVWSLLVCLLALLVMRGWRDLRALRSPRTAALLTLAASVLAMNWGIYIYSVGSGQVVQASLGYFINPLVTVLLGVVVLHERLSVAQWIAVAIGTVAVTVLTVDYGQLPWIALSLAFSFALYGLLKKTVGVSLGALAGLSGETLALAPVAVAGLAWLELTGRETFTDDAPWHGVLLALCGVITVVPLLMFAASARRVPLSTLGLLQYLTPVLQLLCAVLILGERMATSRWIGFGLVWVALLVLTVDSLAQARSRHRTSSAGLDAEADPNDEAAEAPDDAATDGDYLAKMSARS